MTAHSKSDRLDELHVGQAASVCRTVTSADVAAFAQLSGDYNALHLDSEFAARTEFARPVAHGFLHASMLSTLIGMKLPGCGALYLSQTIEFSAPMATTAPPAASFHDARRGTTQKFTFPTNYMAKDPQGRVWSAG